MEGGASADVKFGNHRRYKTYCIQATVFSCRESSSWRAGRGKVFVTQKGSEAICRVIGSTQIARGDLWRGEFLTITVDFINY